MTNFSVQKRPLKEWVRSIISKYGDGSIVDKPEDHELLMDLIKKHPEAVVKVGAGIEKFSVQTEQLKWEKNKHFAAHRIDGTSTDFSWIKCIDGASKRKLALAAMRYEIEYQVIEFSIREELIRAVHSQTLF